MKQARSTLFEKKARDKTWKTFTYGSYANKIQRSFKKHSDIQIAFKSNTKLKDLLGNPKAKIKEEDRSGIYEIPCNNCNAKYIGQTKRKLKVRLKEHQAHFKNNQEEKSAMAKHCLQENHTFSSVNLLQEVRNPLFLDAWESLYIKKHQDILVNNEPGIFQNSPLLY